MLIPTLAGSAPCPEAFPILPSSSSLPNLPTLQETCLRTRTRRDLAPTRLVNPRCPGPGGPGDTLSVCLLKILAVWKAWARLPEKREGPVLWTQMRG